VSNTQLNLCLSMVGWCNDGRLKKA